MNTESQTDRITQLESSCAAMRELLITIRQQVFPGSDLPPKYTVWMHEALSSDSGKALLDRLQKAEGEVEKWQGEFDTVRDLLHQSQDRRQAVEAERDRYKAALEKIGRIGKTVGFSRAACSSVAMEALQPAQKDAPEKGTK